MTPVNLKASFERIFSNGGDIRGYFAPGRVNLIGEHIDYNGGHVFPCALTVGNYVVARKRVDRKVRFYSENYKRGGIIERSLDDMTYDKDKVWTNYPFGVMWAFAKRGMVMDTGLDVYVYGNIPGSGLSSSAAFEVLIGTILDIHYNKGAVGAVDIAKMGQFAENKYFGKNCGLMDQMVSSVGGFVFIDFADPTKPVIDKHVCDFAAAGISLCITDTKGSHADLTADYVSIPVEMKSVAAHFGKEVLHEVAEADFFAEISALRGKVSDRAILRAAHFFADDARVPQEVAALDAKDFQKFFDLVKASGNSSAKWLQNVYSIQKPEEQGVNMGLMVSEKVLDGKGASRVHGGGFAGTIQAFVPTELVDKYVTAMENLFGEGSCYRLNIRPLGGVQVM